MDEILQKRSKGQVLVIVTLMLVGLLAMLALVLDGGNIYTQRRQMQTAADAGALAGARHLCGDTPNHDAAGVDANKYAIELNHAQDATVSFPGGGLIEVTTYIEFDPFFVHIIGISDLSATATAAAQCTTPGAGNVIPITWYCPPPAIPEEGEEPPEEPPEDYKCGFKFSEEDDEDKQLYVFMDSDETATQWECIYPPNATKGDPYYVSGTLDCDWDDDGADDFLDAANRGWLDIDGSPNDNADELRDKLYAACVTKEGEDITDHVWVGGQPGEAAAVFQATKEYCEGKDVIIPVFDTTCGDRTNDPENDCIFTPPHPDEYIIKDGAAYYYHIVGFAAFHITCVHASASDKGEKVTFPDGTWAWGSRCEARNLLQLANQDSDFLPGGPLTVEGYLSREISSDVYGAGGIDSGTYVIHLVK